MASLFKDKRSPYWYLRFKGPDGKWKLKSTPFRIGKGTDTMKAREMAAEHSLKERQNKTVPSESWGQWVPGFLAGRQQSPLTLTRYQGAFFQLQKFLEEVECGAPRALTYGHCQEFLAWRKGQKIGRRTIAHNTALFDVKVLGIIMSEAVRRGFAPGNPCRELGIGREKAREKPALTDEQITLIRRELRTRPDWMRHAFELAIHHGCRISECRVAMSDVDTEAGVLYFRSTKGDKPFAAPIHPGILPLIAERRKARARLLCEVPLRNGPKLFHQFFQIIGLKGVSFHCTRVTVATWLARDATVPEKQAMHYLNHASETIHRAYQRWRPSDVSAVVAAVNPPRPAP